MHFLFLNFVLLFWYGIVIWKWELMTCNLQELRADNNVLSEARQKMEDQLKMSRKQLHSLIEDVTHTQAALNEVNSVSDHTTTNGFQCFKNPTLFFIAVSQNHFIFYLLLPCCCKLFGLSFYHDFCPTNASIATTIQFYIKSPDY